MLNVVVQVLAEAQGVDVAQVHLHLASGGKLLRRVVVVEVVLPAPGVVGRLARGLEPGPQVQASAEDFPQREAEALDGGLHALEHVHAHEVCHRGGAVHLAVEVLAPGVPVALHVPSAPVVADVGEELVLGEGELGDHVVELRDGRQLALCVDGRAEGQRRPALREGPAGGTVVLGDVLATSSDCEHVQQLEVVGVDGVDEAFRRAVGVGELAPLVEARLGHLRHLGDRGYAVGLGQVRVVALGDELDLVAQVQQAVVHRRGREHEHLGADALLDDVLDQAGVAVLLLCVCGLVPEVVGLVDDQQVVVLPADVLQVDVAAHAVIAGQVGVVEHVVGEAVVRKRIAVVVGAPPQGPVLAQALGTQHEHAAVALLVVLDDGQSLVGLSKADAVGDDAALVLLELADGAHHRIALEVVELAPNHGLLEPEAGQHRVVPVVLQEVPEDVIEGEEVHELR